MTLSILRYFSPERLAIGSIFQAPIEPVIDPVSHSKSFPVSMTPTPGWPFAIPATTFMCFVISIDAIADALILLHFIFINAATCRASLSARPESLFTIS